MNREQFISELTSGIVVLPEPERSEILADYEQHFQLGRTEGRSEEEIIAELGSPDSIIQDIMEGFKEIADVWERTETVSKKENILITNTRDGDSYVQTIDVEKTKIITTTDEEPFSSKSSILRFTFPHIFGMGIPLKKSKSFDVAQIEVLDMNICNSDVQFVPTDEMVMVVDFVGKYRKRSLEGMEFRMEQQNEKLIIAFDRHVDGKLQITVPRKKFRELFLKTTSGNVSMNEMKLQTMNTKTASGDLKLNKLEAEEMFLHTTSGDISAHTIQANSYKVRTTSGDIEMNHMESNSMNVETASGDLQGNEIKAMECTIQTASGGLTIHTIDGEKIKFQTASGDMKLTNANAENIQLQATSGDLRVTKICATKTRFQTSTGDIHVKEMEGDIEIHSVSGDSILFLKEIAQNVLANSVSGEVKINVEKSPESLDVQFQSRSGESNIKIPMEFQKKSDHEVRGKIGEGEYKIKVSTLSGDFKLHG